MGAEFAISEFARHMEAKDWIKVIRCLRRIRSNVSWNLSISMDNRLVIIVLFWRYHYKSSFGYVFILGPYVVGS